VIAAQTPASGRRDPTSLRVDDPLEARQTTPDRSVNRRRALASPPRNAAPRSLL